MSGRLGMTGDGYVRGDKRIGFAKARPFKPPNPGQLKTWGIAGGGALAAGGVAHHRRKNNDRVGGAAAGAVAGGLGADTAAEIGRYGLRELNQHQLRKPKNKQTSAHRRVQSDWKHELGVGSQQEPPHRYFREYPKELPGWRTTRTLARLSTPKAAGTIAAAGAATGAVVGGRKIKRERVKKGELQLLRNGKNVLHLQPANPEHKKVWGAPARMLVVGSGEKRPAGRVLLPTRRQWANWGGGAALTVGGAKVVSDQVKKREGDHRRRNAIAAGTAAGVGAADLATNVAGWGTREGIKYHEQLVNAGKLPHPLSRKARSRVLEEHKAKHGVGSNTKDAPQAYYREWPKELPGARARQLMGHKNRPTVVAGILGTGAALGAGYGAVKSRNVKKALPAGHGTKIPRWQMQWRMNDTTPAPSARYKTPPLEVPGAYKFTSAEHKAKYPLAKPGKRKRTLVDRYLGREGTGKYDFGKVEKAVEPLEELRAQGRAPRRGTLLLVRRNKGKVDKVDTTMSEKEAKRIAARYDTRGPLPKGLSREQKMKAYEGRYIAAGGKEGEKWKRRADAGEVQRNVGLATATVLGGASLIARHPRIKAKHPSAYKKLEVGSLAGAVHGGAAELYSEHARSRRASYQNSPAGVAGSALSRMRAYTPGAKS